MVHVLLRILHARSWDTVEQLGKWKSAGDTITGTHIIICMDFDYILALFLLIETMQSIEIKEIIGSIRLWLSRVSKDEEDRLEDIARAHKR